jgi:hypothetical protein
LEPVELPPLERWEPGPQGSEPESAVPALALALAELWPELQGLLARVQARRLDSTMPLQA